MRAASSAKLALVGAMSTLEAAALPVNYFTAWQLVVVMGGLKPGETVPAGGGVGIAATQIARHIGATVIGTASASKQPNCVLSASIT
jgi:NADPH:quinone reductase-like Zn-dependent oxidoreductase